MTRAELISIIAAILWQGRSTEDAMDIAISIANEAERRCQKEAPQPQEFEPEGV